MNTKQSGFLVLLLELNQQCNLSLNYDAPIIKSGKYNLSKLIILVIPKFQNRHAFLGYALIEASMISLIII